MRPVTPNLQVVGPTSPPETPRNISPTNAYPHDRFRVHQKVGVNENPRSCLATAAARPMSQIAPGPGQPFSHTHSDQLSPRSSSSFSETSSDSDPNQESLVGPGAHSLRYPSSIDIQKNERKSDRDADDSHGETAATAATAIGNEIHFEHARGAARPRRIVAYAEVNFTVEEMESDCDAEDNAVVRPTAIEYPHSERSRSRSRERARRGMMDSFACLGFHDSVVHDSSEDEQIDPDAHRRIIQQIREQKRRRRMTLGSIGKRTISESIGSDTDNEDVLYFVGTDEVGSSARRLRRKYERDSFIFQDPDPSRIDEMDELATKDDEMFDVEIFANELPYWMIMELD